MNPQTLAPPSEKTVLIVEDDPTLLRGITDNFASSGYSVQAAADGETAIEKALMMKPSLIILDVMLPRVNGYEVCRYLRQENFTAPIIFLTAKGEESDVLLGLGIGADDYIAKPFSIRELLARSAAVLRRSATNESSSQADELSFGNYQLKKRSRRLRDGSGHLVSLSPREYELLQFFLEHRGRALSRQQLIDGVWGYDSRVTPRSVDRFVTQLRKSIESTPGEFIETIRAFGYRFRVGDTSAA
ncbi:MAG: response regulator transcription factor [Verrucomicrobiales bacterium]|nr:response regulator transcription factor [Verrucomicrobiales bacterium]